MLRVLEFTQRLLLLCAPWLLAQSAALAQAPSLKILFLGDNGHHHPAERFRQLQPVLGARGIDIVYTDTAAALNVETLSKYDGLIVYANIEKIAPEQEKALLDYVASGKGFIPIHCASYCFLNSPKYIELVGGQFLRHGTGTFRATVAQPEHPIMKGYRGFESFDETYVHTKHNDKDRIVLEYREETGKKEPWSWVRTHGKGRVFYTAWGHDDKTWGNAGFQELVERGIRWACGDENPQSSVASRRGRSEPPEMTPLRKDVKPFQYAEAKVPFYPPAKGGPTRKTTMQLPVEPAESMKHMVHPVEFELKLFASDPQIKRPICMNWDERGRLWIAESVDYPNERQPEGQGHDRIVICEDTDGDGVADKFTVFADKLSIPTGFTFYKDGIIVVQAPHTLWLRSTKRNDICDERIVLFSGWHTNDSHAGPSNLRYGFDNWIYGMCGYAGFDGVVGGERHSFRQGFFRFKITPPAPPSRGGETNVSPPSRGGETNVSPPSRGGETNASPSSKGGESDASPPLEGGAGGVKLEFLRSTNNNSWGVGFSEEGLIFGSTANGNPSVYLPIPNRYYEQVRGWSSKVLGGIAGNAPMHPITDKVRQVDYHGHFTAAAGHALYTARAYPKEYWNRAAFICEPTGHLVSTFLIERQGADFRSHNAWNLLASDDEWTAPTMAEVGPDGNVWIIDWYNYIVQHNPTPVGFKTGKGNAYETPLRDKTHGRIYRLVMKDEGGKVKDEGGRRKDEGNGVFSLKDASPEKLVATLKNDNLFWRLHAQRLLVERGKVDVVPALSRLALDESLDEMGLNVGVIHALWTLQGLDAFAEKDAATIAVQAMMHKSAAVRRNAALVVPRRAEFVPMVTRLTNDADPQVRLAALLAVAEMPSNHEAGRSVAAMLRQASNFDDGWLPDAITAAAARHDLGFLKAMLTHPSASRRIHDITGVVAEHFARGGPIDSVTDLLDAMPKAEETMAATVLGALAKGWRQKTATEPSPQTEQALARVAKALPGGQQGNLIKLAQAMGSKAFANQLAEVAKSLLASVEDESKEDAARLAAARQAVELLPADDKVVAQLLAAVTPRTSPTFDGGIIDALGGSQAPTVGESLIKKIPGFAPTARQAAVRVLLSRPDSTRALLDGLDKGQVQLAELSLDQKQALANHPSKLIATRAKTLLERGGGLPSADRQKVIDQFTPLLKQTGDAANGKVLFKKHCIVCHTHSGEGAKIGPDLTGMAVHPKHELLVAILDPSRSVEGNYRLYQVVTEEGKVMNGLLASETKTSIEIYDAEGKKHVLQRDNVSQLIATNKSLMPDGFEKQLKESELVDLLEFLTARGKFLPLPLNKVATAVSTRGMFYSEDSPVERLIFQDWGPKTFEGVPFQLVDPQGERVPNVILMYGPQGKLPPKMPKSVSLPCNSAAKAIHFLSGISGWGYPYSEKGSVSLIVRLHYADGTTEDHALKNGEHFADYIRRVDVPGSKFAFGLRGQQVRYLSVIPDRPDVIESIELVKGNDVTAPVVMAITVETR